MPGPFPPEEQCPYSWTYYLPGASVGLLEWLGEPISLLNSTQKPQEVLPREEKNLTGYRDVRSAQGTFLSLSPKWDPGRYGEEAFS